jgi:S-adenosylhomocysteine hydrolase
MPGLMALRAEYKTTFKGSRIAGCLHMTIKLQF